MNVIENVCPICKHKNELEAIVCGNCGAALEDPFMDPGASTKTTDMPELAPERLKEWPVDQAAAPGNGMPRAGGIPADQCARGPAERGVSPPAG